MISSRPAPERTAAARPPLIKPETRRLLQLAVTLLAAVYMLLAGGTFDASVRYRVQLLNTVLAGGLALLWLVVSLARCRRITATGLEWPLGVFAVSQWLALATSAQPRLGLEWVASVTAWTAALLMLTDVLRAGWPRAYFVNGLVLIAVIVTTAGVAEVAAFYVGWLRLGQWPPVTFRLTGLLGHANLTATFINLLLPLVLVRGAQVPQRSGRTALRLLAAGMLLVLFFTSSRAGWLAAGAGLTALAGLVLAQRGAAAGLAGLGPRWRSLPAPARWMWGVVALLAAGTLAALLLAQSQHITHVSLLNSRQTFWEVAWRMFELQPLLGAGPDLFPWFYTRWVAAPPGWFAPHAHSLVMQILGGSGLLGLAALAVMVAGIARELWRRWQAGLDRGLFSGIGAGLAGFAFQQLFDYLLGSALIVFVIVVVLSLALSGPAPRPAARVYPVWALAAAMMLPLAVAVFALRGAGLNDRGLTLADEGDWLAAASAFEAAAVADPGLTLYWQHAALARTHAGHTEAALAFLARAAQDDPYWPLPRAALGVLARDAEALTAAHALAGSRHPVYALNLGIVEEELGRAEAARAAYGRALDLRPASAAALFWQQTALRRSVVAEWVARRGGAQSPLALGELALAAGDAAASVAHFERALDENPADLEAYAGLAQSHQALGDAAAAERYRQAALHIPSTGVHETWRLRMLAGDSALAQGDEAGAAAAYAEVFSIFNDYTTFGPGSYGYPQRSWYVFRRQALPSDLPPQFARADITPEMDTRFRWLAEYYAGQAEAEIACLIAERVWREAPVSETGELYASNCG